MGVIQEEAAELAKAGKYCAALKEVSKLPESEKGSRVFVFEGCLYALLKRWNAAAKSFSAALEKDAGNALALAYLKESLRKRRFFSS
jgi:hypothetical protein